MFENFHKSLGIISLTLKKQTDLSLLRRQIRRCSENQYILIRTNPEFSKNRLFARGFRDDHYILAQYEKEGRNYILFNDLPERVLKLPARDFNKAYGGDYFKLEVKRRLNDEDATYLFKKRDFKPEKFIPFYFCECDFADIPNIGERLRNMTGVYKLLRYRFSEYYGDYLESDFIKNALSRIEKYYSIFEYYNLKGDIPYQRYYSHFAELNRLETEIILILKNNMEEKIYAKRNG